MNRLIAGLLLTATAIIAAEPPAIPCRIAYLAKLHYAPVIIACADGLFTKAGIVAEPVVVGPGSGILAAEALATGAADAAAMGDAPMILSSARDPLPVLVGGYASAEGQHRLIARPGIAATSAAGLAGLRIAVMQGSSTHAGLLLLLRRSGIAPATVTIVNLNPKDMGAALQASQVDVAAASDPIPDLILRRVPGSSTVCSLAGLGTDYPYGVMAARRWAVANPGGCARLRAALGAACAVISGDPDRAVRIVAGVTRDTEEDTRRWLSLCRWSVRGADEILGGLQPLADVLAEAGALARPPRLTEAAREP